jgi:murein DD-endopeptidase MepM/ murein hydrolase activator NlpD
VRTGQVIGLLGNSGNTTFPHLHFGIVDGPSFWANSLPFAFGSFIVQGTATIPSPGAVKIIGRPRRAKQAEPLIGDVITFGG